MTQSQLKRRTLLLGLLLAASATAQKAKDVCGDRPHCTVVGTQAALKGHAVVELSLGETGEEDEHSKCEQKEWWLRRPDKSVVKLLEACNDGSTSDGEDDMDVSVTKNRFTRTRSTGTSSGWSDTVELQLSPLLRVSDEFVHARIPSSDIVAKRFNYLTFEGSLTTSGVDDPNEPKKPLTPRIVLPADFLSEGWKHTSLGGCSVNGASVLLGKAQGKEDAQVRAVLAGREPGDVLLVEVVDDTWTGPGEKWLADDHLELWMSDWEPTSMDPDSEEGDGKEHGLVQWGIRIADGRVFPAYGDPTKPLDVEVVREGKVARLKIQLPMSGPGGLTVVYSDSDGGKKQELLVATSPLQFGHASTLSTVWSIASTKATCQVKGDKLVPVPTELHPKPGETVIHD